MLAGVLIVVSLGLLFLAGMYFRAEQDYLDTHVIEDSAFPFAKELHIVFISDIHNREINPKTLNKLKNVDVVIIGGDLVDKRTPLTRLKNNLEKLKQWKAPVYFIPGNNDHELEKASLLDVLDNHHIHVLSNSDHEVTFQSEGGFLLSGIDPYFMKPRRQAAYINDHINYQILCVHDPYVYHKMNQQDQKQFDLVLSGHTHGGQIRLFGLGPYTRGGWFESEKPPLLISEGYGTSLLPLRLGTRAELHSIIIKSS
ncbi:Predicted phosphohydrolase, MPP superfamily [Halobacillus alkaliphilus]|uniref:Predicted phosphohydrolase, MPP superfamily n=1 Tax=Halobacillus alkaliphilus TaxID=396056 RepID=A0A1I2K7T6_9BACI|nr:metallophosphoesterase [Halobacillus alkaliphilus]SFF62260.1 Predicted phosphohydrolase, MPP superfamily [Halobacillus alkaliphilus]